MCGIWGFVSSVGEANVKQIKELMTSNDLRGGHSFGIYISDGKENFSLKGKGESGLLDFNDIVKSYRNEAGENLKTNIVLGQSRLCTSDNPADINDISTGAPLVFDDCVIIHNGFNPNWKIKAKQVGYAPSGGFGQNDSELLRAYLQNSIGKGDVEDTVSNRLKKDGVKYAFAIVKDDVLYLSANGLPLYFWEAEEGIYFSSVKTTYYGDFKKMRPSFRKIEIQLI